MEPGNVTEYVINEQRYDKTGLLTGPYSWQRI